MILFIYSFNSFYTSPLAYSSSFSLRFDSLFTLLLLQVHFIFKVSVNVETSFCHLPLLLFSYLFIYVKPIIFHNVCNLGLSFFWVINNLLSFHCIVTKMTFSLFMDILCVLLFLTSLFILFW